MKAELIAHFDDAAIEDGEAWNALQTDKGCSRELPGVIARI
jgi:hypothetical protein